MQIKLISILSAVLATTALGQSLSILKPEPMVGNFYMETCGPTLVYINGQEVVKSPGNIFKSSDIQLAPGDRLVMSVKKVGPRRILLLFASADGKKVISFKKRDFKIAPVFDATDFTVEDFKKWNKFALEVEKDRPYPQFPKSSSEFVWGDTDRTVVAAIITQEMIRDAVK